MLGRAALAPLRLHSVSSSTVRRLYASTPKSAAAVLTHVNRDGEASMVDISEKTATKRTAVAAATVHLGPTAFAALAAERNAKGNVLVTARLAGIMAAKRTADLIPLCHPLGGLTQVSVELRERAAAHALDIEASATCVGATGVEMEAMCAASVAALTVYDMCKAAHKGIVISDVRLLSKSGGRSGDWRAGESDGEGGGV